MSRNALALKMTARADDRFAQTLGKPAYNAECNGCGYCCLMMPCLISMSLFGDDIAECPALEFKDGKYRCGLMFNLAAYDNKVRPEIPKLTKPGDHERAQRYIAERLGQGRGCDARTASERGYGFGNK